MEKFLKKATQIMCASFAAVTMMTGALPETVPMIMPITASAADSLTPAKVVAEEAYNASSDAIRIHWKKVNNATGYRVYRYIDGKWQKIKTIQNNNTFEYRDSGLAPAKTYSYKVKAYRKVNGVNYWGVSCDTKKAVTTPVKPTLTVLSVSQDSADLSWPQVTCSGYQLQQYVNGAWKNICDIAKTESSYTVTGLAPGTSYKFRLRAYKSDTVNDCRKYKESDAKTFSTASASSVKKPDVSSDIFGQKLIKAGAAHLGKSYYGMDCSLFVQTTLDDLGYKFSGFGEKGARVNSNGIPRATYDWLKCKDSNNPPKISIDGGNSWIPLEISKCSRSDGRYWLTDDGKEIEPGSIVVTSSHMFIYVGAYNSHGIGWSAQTSAVRAYLKSLGINASKVDRYTCSSWLELNRSPSDHWKLESQAGTSTCPIGRFAGVVINDGTKSAYETAYVYNVSKSATVNFTFELNDDELGVQTNGTSGRDTMCVFYLYETDEAAMKAVESGNYTADSVAKVTMKTNGRQRLKLDPITAGKANWAVEYRAPKGYKMLAKPVKIERDDKLSDKTNHIYHSKLRGDLTVRYSASGANAVGRSFMLSGKNENGKTVYSETKMTDSSGRVTFSDLDVYDYTVGTVDGKTVLSAAGFITYTVSEMTADGSGTAAANTFTFEQALLNAGSGNPYKVSDDISESVVFYSDLIKLADDKDDQDSDTDIAEDPTDTPQSEDAALSDKEKIDDSAAEHDAYPIAKNYRGAAFYGRYLLEQRRYAAVRKHVGK